MPSYFDKMKGGSIVVIRGTRGPVFFTQVLALCAALVPSVTFSQSRPDLSGLSSEELRSIESACSSAKYVSGPAVL